MLLICPKIKGATNKAMKPNVVYECTSQIEIRQINYLWIKSYNEFFDCHSGGILQTIQTMFCLCSLNTKGNIIYIVIFEWLYFHKVFCVMRVATVYTWKHHSI